MICILSVVSACAFLSIAEGSGVATGLPYIANYASSYSAHTINHDIRYPAAIVAPAVRAINTPVIESAARLTTSLPVVQSAPLITPVAQVFPASFSAYGLGQIATPVAPFTSLPAFQAAPQLVPVPNTAVENPGRSGDENGSEEPISELSRSTQAREPQESNRLNAPSARPVPNPVLTSSQFLARQLSFQNNPKTVPALPNVQAQDTPTGRQQPDRALDQGPNNQGFSARSVALQNAASQPQNQFPVASAAKSQALFRAEQGPRPGFLVRGNLFQRNEGLNNEDSEAVEVNAPDTTQKQVRTVSPANARFALNPVGGAVPSYIPSVFSQIVTF